MMKKILTAAGYETFAADKTSKEKFLLDLEGAVDDQFVNESLGAARTRTRGHVLDNVTAENLWGVGHNKEPREVFIMADEFNEFVGVGNLEFYTTLGNLWDWDSDSTPFSQRLKNSRSIAIWQPTVNILGGNTPENFARAFPPEIIGQGFLSRLVLIHGERSGRKYPFPPTPSKEQTDALTTLAKNIRGSLFGSAELDNNALRILGSIYSSWEEIADVRFRAYSNRRFTQLLKLCLILAAACGRRILTEVDVVTANTYLTAAENLMPQALGEFGKSKNSDVANKIVDIIYNTKKPLSAIEIWGKVHKDLEKMSMLLDILNGLNVAKRIQHVKDKGWLPLRAKKTQAQYVDYTLLTNEERGMI
jgi:hypothetical protein